MLRWLRCLWEGVLDLLYPRDCVMCGKAVETRVGHFCERCRQEAWPHHHARCSICAAESGTETQVSFLCQDCQLQPPAFEKAFVALCYYGEIREVIHLFKYRRGIWLVHDFVYFLEMVYALEILASGIEVDLVVPVPMTDAKRRKRGFNQAALLAKFFAKKVGLRYQAHLLCRRQTQAPVQARLQRKERFQYAQMAYHFGRPMDLSGKTVLLIDDVMTTGATVNACATLLKQQGATVYVLALARPFFG